MLIIFISFGKQDNTNAELWYGNVGRPEDFKCSRLARIEYRKYTACGEANDKIKCVSKSLNILILVRIVILV